MGRLSRGWVPLPRGLPSRVAVVGDQLLTAQAVSAALATRGYLTGAFEVPRQLDDPRVLRRGWGPGVSLGVLLHERVDRPHTQQVLRLLQALSGLPWLVLTGVREGPQWGAVLEAGARGVMPVTAGLVELVEAIERLSAGEELHSEAERERLVAEWRGWSTEHAAVLARLELLTPRESEVLEALRQGATVTEVALAGGVSVDTVRSQVRSVLRKLQVPSQLAAVAILQQSIDLLPAARGVPHQP